MARKTTRKTARKEKLEIEESPVSDYGLETKEQKGQRKFNPILGILLVAVLLLGLLLYRNKDLIIAASVNGKPIYTWNLNAQLKSQYGKPVLEQMINEQILQDEAAKKNIKVSKKEIDDKVAEAVKTLPEGMKLADALSQQGLTEDSFRKQVEIRVIIDKLMADKVKVTSKEVDDYLTQNGEILETQVGSDSAQQREYAEDTLKQQKSSEEFSKWFAEVKKKAKVEEYLR